MTVPRERTNAVRQAEAFLRRLCDPKETPRIPRDIRREAAWLLKHYPTGFEMCMAARGAPDWFEVPAGYDEKLFQEKRK